MRWKYFKRFPTSETKFLNQINGMGDAKKVFKDSLGIKHAKFTVLLEKNGQIKEFLVQNSNAYSYHLDFLSQERNILLKPEVFTLKINSPNSLFLIGTLYFLKDSTIGFNLITREKSLNDAFKVKKILGILKEKVSGFNDFIYLYGKENFKFKSYLDKAGVTERRSISDQFASIRPIVYNSQTSFGYIRVLDLKEASKGEYGPKDILVLDSIPLNIGPVSGIITTTPQVPNSHVFLRALELKIPNIYIPKNGLEGLIGGNKDQLVKFSIDPLGDKILIEGKDELDEELLLEEAEEYYEKRKPKGSELKVGGAWKHFKFTNKEKLKKKLPESYGAKGVNFLILDRALHNKYGNRSGFSPAFLVPFILHRDMLSYLRMMFPLCEKAKKICIKNGEENYCNQINKICETRTSKTTEKSMKRQLEVFKEIKGKELTDFELNEKLNGLSGNIEYYERYGHLTDKLGEFINHILDEYNDEMIRVPKMRRSFLAYIRAIIQIHPLIRAKKIIKDIKKALPEKQKWRARSSTNAEDLPFFTGAGLYDSKAICLYDTYNNYEGDSKCRSPGEIKTIKRKIADVEKLSPSSRRDADLKYLKKRLKKRYPIYSNLKKVIASVWNDEAFLFRDYYGLSHTDVFMGVLVHPSFDNEQANGVALVKKTDQGTTYSLSSQFEDNLVTNPFYPGMIPEEILIEKKSNGEMVKNYISYSNILPEGRENVLSKKQLKRLLKEIDVSIEGMENYYYKGYGIKYDVEYIVGENNKIIILQIRPLEQGKKTSKLPKNIAGLRPHRVDYTSNKHGWGSYTLLGLGGASFSFHSYTKPSWKNDFGPLRPYHLFTTFSLYEDNIQIFKKEMDLKGGDDSYDWNEWYEDRVLCREYKMKDRRRSVTLKSLIPEFKSFKGNKKRFCNLSLDKKIDYTICVSESPMGNIALIMSKNDDENYKLEHINLTGDTTDFDKFWNISDLEDLGTIYGQYKIENNLNERVQLCLNEEKKDVTSGFEVDSWGGRFWDEGPGKEVKGLREKENERRGND